MSHSRRRGVGGRVGRNGNFVGQGPFDFISLVIPFFPNEDQPWMNGWMSPSLSLVTGFVKVLWRRLTAAY